MRPHVCILILGSLLVSCNNAYDAERLAERYCVCMKSNKAANDFSKAADACEEEMLKNRYARLWTVDMNDRELDKAISDETRDSVVQFMRQFTSYIDDHCCKELSLCKDSTTIDRRPPN